MQVHNLFITKINTTFPSFNLPMFTGENAMVLTKIMKKEMTEKNFKTCVRYISLNFYFSPNDSSSKIMKNVFLFHLKSSFRSRDIQIFVFSSSPLFFPVSHCFRGWFKKNLKVYDVINCLNKNLITHFVWYLAKEIRCDI